MSVEPYGDNLDYMQGALLVLNLRLHRQILRWRASHHQEATTDELLGLYISDQEVDALLDGLYSAGAPPDADALDRAPIATISQLLDEAEQRHQARTAVSLQAGMTLRLLALTQRLNLDAFAQNVLVLALAPELNRGYERLFGYLNDDITRRWPSVDLAYGLFCQDLSQRVAHRQAFSPGAPLQALRLLHLSQESAPVPPGLLTRLLKLDERIVAYLLGSDVPDPVLDGLLAIFGSPSLQPPILHDESRNRVAALCAYIDGQPSPAPIVSITGPDHLQQVQVARILAAHAKPGTDLLVLDGEAVSDHANPQDVVARAVREARLEDASLALTAADHLASLGSRAALALHDLVSRSKRPLFLLSAGPWDLLSLPDRAPLLHLELPAPDLEARRRLWSASLNGHAPDVDLYELAERFRLTSGQIAGAARQAYTFASLRSPGDGCLVQREDLFASCREQSTGPLDSLAQRIESIHTWEDLVLPAQIKQQLRSLEHWVRYRHIVYGEWGYAQRVMLGRGLAVLFSGPSGTGKTMAAGIMARNLELDLYRIDLSSVVSKYIGETEKNLSRIFAAAETANAILFFDEADALFGKRSDVKDAHDRYANIEVSYLLQRMEAYDGLAILATNFRQNLDQAFARRLQITIEFPFPQASDRERIWRKLLPPGVPQADDMDLGYLAAQFALAGGSIKNSVLTAAFAAAAEGGPVAMRHLVRAVSQELSKMDQPVVRADFGPYYELL